MSIDDKFYPEDGSLITTIDNFMIKSAGRIGESYQNMTGKNYKDLITRSYKVSMAINVISAAFLNVGGLLFGAYSGLRTKVPKIYSPLEEEMKNEARGRSKKFNKYFRLVLAASVPVTYAMGSLLTHHPGNLQGLSAEFLNYYSYGIQISAVGVLPIAFAEYLSKADVKKPPKKTVFSRLYKKRKQAAEKTVREAM